QASRVDRMKPRLRRWREPQAFSSLPCSVGICLPLEALPISEQFLIERASIATQNHHPPNRPERFCQFTVSTPDFKDAIQIAFIIARIQDHEMVVNPIEGGVTLRWRHAWARPFVEQLTRVNFEQDRDIFSSG